MRSRAAALAGSALHLVLAPGTLVGLLPFLISRWQSAGEFGGSMILRSIGAFAFIAGAIALLESFVRFAWTGLGTPAPVAPTQRLIVGGLYRYVRNPIYVAAVAMIAGQELWFGNFALLAYAGVVWLAFHLFVILYEEPTLRRQFPGDYQNSAMLRAGFRGRGHGQVGLADRSPLANRRAGPAHRTRLELKLAA